MKRILAPALAVVLASHPSAIAGDGKLTIEPGAFAIHESFTATALPSSASLISLNAASWSDFEITKIASHGATVKKGEVLIAFDSRQLEKSLADLEKTLERREHEIAAARRELTELRETADDRLAKSRKAAEEAADDYQHQHDTRQPIEIESANQSIRNAESRLRNAKEELVQLQRMYEADDLVEETEEIILTRAREAVEASEFYLRFETINQIRRIDTTLPRQLKTLLETKQETARKLATDEAEIPRAITLKELDLANLETTQARDKENLAHLVADRALLEITAPADGIFYHGVIENGEWSTPAELLRTLVAAGRPPVKRPLATLIPADARLDFHAMLPEATARAFGAEKPNGLATLTGRGDVSIAVALVSLAPVPTPDNRHHAVFTADWPKSTQPAPGATAEIHLITYAREDAITVPASALAYGTKGWQVELKLADGKTEKRPVTRGRSHGERVEILQGLEPGQVIVLP